jgi:hypothetical protein
MRRCIEPALGAEFSKGILVPIKDISPWGGCHQGIDCAVRRESAAGAGGCRELPF